MEIVEIPKETILPARAALATKGIYCEHTTAGNYAAYLKYCELHGRTPDSSQITDTSFGFAQQR